MGRGVGGGGSIGFEFARVGEEEDKGGVQVYEANKVKKKGKNTLSFTSPEILFFYIYEVKTSPGKGKRHTIHYGCMCCFIENSRFGALSLLCGSILFSRASLPGRDAGQDFDQRHKRARALSLS
jgi:hypothetical protein